jgi:type II restriction enzyme
VNARIPIIQEGNVRPRQAVRDAYERLRPLEELQVEKRGWTLDVLQVVQSLNLDQFSLQDVYGHAADLAKLHPKNTHVRDKIRQQLQILRDLGFVQFLGGGEYRLL